MWATADRSTVHEVSVAEANVAAAKSRGTMQVKHVREPDDGADNPAKTVAIFAATREARAYRNMKDRVLGAFTVDNEVVRFVASLVDGEIAKLQPLLDKARRK